MENFFMNITTENGNSFIDDTHIGKKHPQIKLQPSRKV